MTSSGLFRERVVIMLKSPAFWIGVIVFAAIIAGLVKLLSALVSPPSAPASNTCPKGEITHKECTKPVCGPDCSKTPLPPAGAAGVFPQEWVCEVGCQCMKNPNFSNLKMCPPGGPGVCYDADTDSCVNGKIVVCGGVGQRCTTPSGVTKCCKREEGGEDVVCCGKDCCPENNCLQQQDGPKICCMSEANHSVIIDGQCWDRSQVACLNGQGMTIPTWMSVNTPTCPDGGTPVGCASHFCVGQQVPKTSDTVACCSGENACRDTSYCFYHDSDKNTGYKNLVKKSPLQGKCLAVKSNDPNAKSLKVCVGAPFDTSTFSSSPCKSGETVQAVYYTDIPGKAGCTDDGQCSGLQQQDQKTYKYDYENNVFTEKSCNLNMVGCAASGRCSELCGGGLVACPPGDQCVTKKEDDKQINYCYNNMIQWGGTVINPPDQLISNDYLRTCAQVYKPILGDTCATFKVPCTNFKDHKCPSQNNILFSGDNLTCDDKNCVGSPQKDITGNTYCHYDFPNTMGTYNMISNLFTTQVDSCDPDVAEGCDSSWQAQMPHRFSGQYKGPGGAQSTKSHMTPAYGFARDAASGKINSEPDEGSIPTWPDTSTPNNQATTVRTTSVKVMKGVDGPSPTVGDCYQKLSEYGVSSFEFDADTTECTANFNCDKVVSSGSGDAQYCDISDHSCCDRVNFGPVKGTTPRPPTGLYCPNNLTCEFVHLSNDKKSGSGSDAGGVFYCGKE